MHTHFIYLNLGLQASAPEEVPHRVQEGLHHRVLKSVTTYVSEQKCTTLQDLVERKVPREHCESVPRQECK